MSDEWKTSEYGAKADALAMLATRPVNPRDNDEYRRMAAEREADYQLGAGLYADLGVPLEPLAGLDVHAAAVADLAVRGIRVEDADAETLLAAYVRVGA
jgi:hypothetical protein